MKRREAIISIARALKVTLKEGVTSREIAKYASRYGYVSSPIDKKVIREVKDALYHIRHSGKQVKVINDEKGQGYTYKYTLTETGRDYHDWLKNHYREKVGRFPPQEV